MKTQIIINETHTLMKDQVRVLDKRFGPDGWTAYPVPEKGWTLKEIEALAWGMTGFTIVFASPVPALLLKVAQNNPKNTFVLHNDCRVAKELPGGRIIHTVAPEGWVLV